MPLEDYLMPNEAIKYQSDFNVQYGDKFYTVILTDSQLIFYARRGLFFKGDDVVTEAVRDIQGIKYKETGMLVKSSHLLIVGKTQMDLTGNQASIKALYQRLLPFLSPQMQQPMQAQTYYMQGPPVYQTPPPPQQVTYSSMKYCANCGINCRSKHQVL